MDGTEGPCAYRSMDGVRSAVATRLWLHSKSVSMPILPRTPEAYTHMQGVLGMSHEHASNSGV